MRIEKITVPAVVYTVACHISNRLYGTKYVYDGKEANITLVKTPSNEALFNLLETVTDTYRAEPTLLDL